MRRPEVELSDKAAAFVEQHPHLVESLAGRAVERTSDTPETAELRAGVRERVREYLAASRTEEAQAARQASGQAFLARYGLPA